VKYIIVAPVTWKEKHPLRSWLLESKQHTYWDANAVCVVSAGMLVLSALLCTTGLGELWSSKDIWG